MKQIYKYPRTHHIRGSRLQPGDEDLNDIPFAEIKNRYVVVEEKVDGANAAISFSADGRIQLQSRGHYLTGGPREKHFNLFKQWA
ncbi:MAG: RNA ligase family protein, partial [Cyanobacteria bacterium J06643_5]